MIKKSMKNLIEEAIVECKNKIYPDIKAKIFAQYPMNKVKCNHFEGTIFGVSWYMEESFMVGLPDGKTISGLFTDHPGLKLILKPLLKIWDEDAIAVARLYFFDEDEKLSVFRDEENKRVVIFQSFKHKGVPNLSHRDHIIIYKDSVTYDDGVQYESMRDNNGPLFIYDLLRQLGYALPWKQYSVEELIKAGVYHLID